MPTSIAIPLAVCTAIVSALFLVLGVTIKRGGHNSIKKIVFTVISLTMLLAVGYICSISGIHPSTIFVFAILLIILGVCIRLISKNRNSDVIESIEPLKKDGKKKHNSKKQSLLFSPKPRVFIVVIATVAIGVVAVVIILLSKDKRVELEYLGSSSVKQVVGQIERSKNKEMTATDTHYCQDLKYIATEWDKNADWFDDLYCDKGSSMRADVATTQKTVIVKLFDGSHMARYTFDADIEYLIDYSFEPSTEKGYGVSIYELKDYLSK